MQLVHKRLHRLKHLWILPKPFVAHHAAQRRHAGDKEPDTVLGTVDIKLMGLGLELALGKPFHDGGAFHRTHDEAVFDLNLADVHRGKENVIAAHSAPSHIYFMNRC